jgi:hypothetical protein
MESYKQDLALIEILPLWQGDLNLMDQSDDQLLSGEAMIQDEYLQDAIPTAKQKVFLMRMQFAYYFGDVDLAIEMLELCEKLMMTIRGHFVQEVFTFFGGLIYMEQARRNRRRYYKKLANNKIQIVQKWVKSGAVNCVHKLWLLNAEYATLNDNKRSDGDEIKKAYDAAISIATRSGFLHDAALANGRAGIRFRSFDDDFWASSYISKAHELYQEWGATAKANQLDHLWNLNSDRISENDASGSFAKGRSRFDPRTSERHKKIELCWVIHEELTHVIDLNLTASRFCLNRIQ